MPMMTIKLDLREFVFLLEQVLTHRSGSIAMLSLIYSEVLKMLRMWSLLNFDPEIFVPRDLHGLPRGYNKVKSKESDQAHVMTSQALLVEVTSLILAKLVICKLRYICFYIFFRN